MSTFYSNFNYPLNEHVLGEIFSLVYDTSYPTIRSLLLTNRYFHSIARPLLYRYVAINRASRSFIEEIIGWLNDSEKAAIPKSIRHIRIGFFYEAEVLTLAREHSMRVVGTVKTTGVAGDAEEEWAIIADLISRTTQLKSLTFASGFMPLVLLNAIHNYPTTIELNISSWTRSSSSAPHDDPTELALLGSPCLKSLQADIYNPACNPNDLRSHAFWRLVRSAPNLHSVVFNIKYGGCVFTWDSAEEMKQWAALGEKFENSTLISENKLRNLKIGGTELANWKGGDLSQLTTLDCKGNVPPQTLASLSSLVHLTLRDMYSTVVNSMLMACSPLISLNVIGKWHEYLSLDTVLTHHGQSLCSFSLHELENNDITLPRAVLELEDLHRIRNFCPNLHDFSFDLNVPEMPPSQSIEFPTECHKPVYAFLSTFPSLRRLQLNFNLGIASGYYNSHFTTTKRDQVPTLEGSSVAQLWYAIHGAPGHATPPKLKELRISQGEAQRGTGFGLLAGWVNWEWKNHCWFKVMPSERDDEPDKLKITRYVDAPDFDQDIWRVCRW